MVSATPTTQPTARKEETPAAIDGAWDLTIRPAAAPAQKLVVNFSSDGSSVSAEMEGPFGRAVGQGIASDRDVSWTVTLEGLPGPSRFRADVDGDVLLGDMTVEMGVSKMTWSLEGVRSGSEARIKSREGSDALVETLVSSGVEYVFGFTGGVSTALERSFAGSGLKDLNARTELSAAWMSYGYNRVKRRPASAVLTWVVGALHASPVVHAAKLDTTPLLMMFMESAAAWDARDVLQDGTDLYPAFKPLSKYIRRVVDGEDIPLVVRQAVLAAGTGKFGPAVLDLTQEAMYQRTTVKTEALSWPSPPAADEDSLQRAVDLIKSAKRPVILAGAGVHLSDATAELRRFVEATGIPVVSSGPGGRGVLPDDHPLYAGDMGQWGYFETGTEFAEEADLWIAVGFSFSQTATMSWTVKKPDQVIHVDVDPTQLGRIFQPTVSIVSDAKMFLGQLHRATQVSGLNRPAEGDADTLAKIAQAKSAHFEMLRSFVGADPIMPAAVGQALAAELPPETIIVNDEGFMAPGMVFTEDKYPAGFASPLGFHYDSLGSTLPVAIGAALAAPDHLVVSVGGDGGFFYDLSDLAVLAENNLKVICIKFNNGGLYGGKTGRAQGGTAAVPHDHWTNYADVDYAGVARAMGVAAERVEKADELNAAIRRGVEADGPYFIEVAAGGSTLHLILSSWAGPNAPRKFGHGDRSVEGSWPN
ncbi:acetolactate synthase-1/2/3 large subunit [Arthrobacter sp. SLBN-100]|uniref:thiamine pyrophosphate-binding protein n=1 Tax=Arthrobacter sp. SLBN-100 TaxID=2768450 RepID=UPI0011530E66|nr:thiamine pyrophosphate-binding protein [Arthrobacter sp. SLBN-100]TQJ62142.1 acetolactate synthase-1/2/3 large subunit [Arthrobacter sp. SLBN-100]TQJ62167.1 acetolactate synthase-1/2/3 large subunit [Arthrobacter sp. SLBN-100]